jgi:hypothetical protein
MCTGIHIPLFQDETMQEKTHEAEGCLGKPTAIKELPDLLAEF